MSPESKQRLVGVIVLVIFIGLLIPFLFSDGAKKRHELAVGEEIDIAEQSIGADVPGRYVDIPVSDMRATVDFQETELPEAMQQPLPEVDSTVFVQEQVQPQVRPTVTQKTVTTKKVIEPVAKKKVIAPIKKKRIIPKAKTVSMKTSSNVSGTFWSVQVGSFSDQYRVESMVSKLQAKGYHVYLQRISTSRGDMVRVLVGRESNRRNAEALASKLKASLNINGYVLSNKKVGRK